MVILHSTEKASILIIEVWRRLKLVGWFEWVWIRLLLSKSIKSRRLILILLRKVWFEKRLRLLLITTKLVIIRWRTIEPYIFKSSELWIWLIACFCKIITTLWIVISIIAYLFILLLKLLRCLTKFKSLILIVESIWLTEF